MNIFKIKSILNNEIDLVPISTIAKIVELANNEADSLAILPIENSIEGIVRPTIDSLYINDTNKGANINRPSRIIIFPKILNMFL